MNVTPRYAPDADTVAIDAALAVKALCQQTIAALERTGRSERGSLPERVFYITRRTEAMHAALAIENEYARDFALKQVVRLCFAACACNEAIAVYRLISDQSIKGRLLAEFAELKPPASDHPKMA